ncbi:MAG: hypothetical protein ACTSR8_14110 [Promethearchaeota archaeon]
MKYSQDEKIVIITGNKKNKGIYWIFFGLLAFICVLFPFFMSNLRYQVSTTANAAMTSIGSVLIWLGGLLFIWGLISLLCNPRGLRSIKTMVLGFMVLYIGFYLVTPTVGFGPRATKISSGSS